MTDQLPGVTHIDLHEGRLTGPFDLPPADMAQVRYEGRVMVVVVADIVDPLTIVTTKDGDVKAKWTFKAVDVALVRDEEMQHRLSDSLHMIGVDEIHLEDVVAPLATPQGMQGVYDEEGAFLGFVKDIHPPIFTGEARAAIGIIEEPETGEEEEDITPEEPKPLFRSPGTPPRPAPPDEKLERIEVYGEPIKRGDPALDAFLANV